MELFIDESGDLGGIKSNKRYFVVAGVVCEEEKVSHTIKPLLRELSLPELKFSRLSYEEKKVVLSKLAALDFGIVYTVLSKNDETLNRWLDRSKRNKLLAAKALHSALILGLGFPEVILDRSHYSKELSKWLAREGIKVTADDSLIRPGLQLADAVANTVYLHYQHKNKELLGVIEDKIIFKRFITEKEILRGRIKSGG